MAEKTISELIKESQKLREEIASGPTIGPASRNDLPPAASVDPGATPRALPGESVSAPQTFAQNLLNSAVFGQGPRIGAAIGDPTFERDLEVGAAQNPVATQLGSLGGLFVGPQGAASRVAGRVAQPLIRHAATLEGRMLTRASLASLGNFAGGTSAITLQNLLENRGEGGSIQERLTDSFNQSFSVANIGLSVVPGAIQARSAARRTRDFDLELEQIEARMPPGERIPREATSRFVTDRDRIANAARFPGSRRRVARLHEDVVKAVKEDVDVLVRRTAGRTPGSGAEAILDLSGTRRSPGRLTRDRRAAFQAAQAAEGGPGAFLPAQASADLRRGIRTIVASRDRVNQPAGELNDVFANLMKITEKSAKGGKQVMPITLGELESIRKSLGDLAKFSKATGATASIARTQKEASDLYAVVTMMTQKYAPRVGKALEESSALRQMQEALPPRRFVDMDDTIVSEFFRRGQGRQARWDALVKNSAPDDVNAVRGWYLGQFVSQIKDPKTGALDPEKFDKLLSRDGQFNKQMFDQVLPGMRDTLRRRAELHNRIFGERTRFKAVQESSGAELLRLGTVATAAGTSAMLLGDPFIGAATLLGVAGTQTFIRRSSLGGVIDDVANRAGRGLTRAPARTATAISEIQEE